MMKTNKILFILVFILLGFSVTGCFGVNGEFRNIRNDVLDNIEGHYYRDVEFGVGSFGLGLAKTAVHFAGDNDAENVNELISKLRKVQVGVYKRKHNRFRERSSYYDMINTLTERMRNNGWKYIVKHCDYNEFSVVFIQDKDDEFLNNLVVVSLERDEIAIVQAEGDIEGLIEVAIRNEGLKFEFSSR